MELDKPFLGITPKTLDAVYVNFAVGKELFMVDVDMTITAKHKRVVAPEFVGVDDSAAPHGFNSKVKKRARRNVMDGLDLNDAISLQNAENRDFSCCPSAALTLASAAEVTFVHLNPSSKKFGVAGTLGNGYNGCAYYSNTFQGSRVTKSGLPCHPSGREFKLKEFYDPEPALIRDMQFVNPPSGEVMEGITAPLATEPFTGYPVDFTAFATCTKTTAVFPTQLCEEEPRRIISLYKGFKRFYIHDTILNWCQIFYNHLKESSRVTF